MVRPILEASTPFPSRVLDLGCGEGKNSAPFARLGRHVDAVDCSAAAVANGQANFPDAKVNWIVQDVSDFEVMPASYDLVIMYGLLHCLNDADEVAAVLAKARLAT